MASHEELRGAGQVPHWRLDGLYTNFAAHDHTEGDGGTIPWAGLTKYITSGVSTGYVGQYTRLARVQLTAQSANVETLIDTLGGNVTTTSPRSARIRLHVNQSVSMGGAPTVLLTVDESSGGISPEDFVLVTTANTADLTQVDLYWCASKTYEYLHFRPIIVIDADAAASFCCYSNQGWSASLPAGTQTAGVSPPSVWHEVGATGEPAFANSWVNYDTARSAKYWRDNSGAVWIIGLIKSGTIGSAAWTLPAGYRPSRDLFFPVDSGINGGYGRVRILANGGVVPYAPSVNTAVYLDGITFPTT